MTRERAAPLPGGTTHGAALTVQATDGQVEIVCLSGVLDADGAAPLTRDLARHAEKASHAGQRLVPDLGEPIFVADVAADPDLAGAEEGLAALATGTRALYAVPALTETGECAGAICVHRMRPGRWMTAARHTALAILADDLAAWRSWYRRTVVLEALEYMHSHAPHRD
jgi:hypothetical protein